MKGLPNANQKKASGVMSEMPDQDTTVLFDGTRVMPELLSFRGCYDRSCDFGYLLFGDNGERGRRDSFSYLQAP